MSIYSAIVAVHPDVESEFVDENALNEMPVEMRQAVEGRNKAGLTGLAVHSITYPCYLVWGSIEGLGAAQLRWGDNLIVMDTWTKNGTRAGTYYENEIDTSDPMNPIVNRVLVGEPVRERHPQLMNILPDVILYDADGNEFGRSRPTDFSTLPTILGHGIREV